MTLSKKELCEKMYTLMQEYRKKGDVRDYGNVYYDLFYANGMIKFAEDRNAEIIEQVRRELFEKQKEQRGVFGKPEPITNDLIEIHAKRKVINIFIADLIETDTKPEDLLNEL